MEFNERIKLLRKSANLNQKEFANKIGITQGAMSGLEKEGTSPKLETLQAICKEFKVDGNWLLLGIESDYLSEEERKIIKGYRNLTEKEKGRIEEIIDSSEGNKIKNQIDKVGNL